MKKRIALALSAALLLCLLPVTALAYDPGTGINYNDNDYYKLQTFLNATSADGVHTNGWQMNNAYDENDPTTWGIPGETTWTSSATDRQLESIEWEYTNLAGTLDMSGFTGLEYLIVTGNSLTDINTTGDTTLRWLWCEGNSLTSIDISTNTNLVYLYCNNNDLTSLDAKNNTHLYEIGCANNKLTSLDVSGDTGLNGLSCYNNALTSIDLTGCTSLKTLTCFENQMETLDLSTNGALTSLHCAENQLTSLDVSHNTALMTLYCDYNRIPTLTLSGLTELRGLSCSDNLITTLDFSDNPLLSLTCNGNPLTALDVTEKTGLFSLCCEGNELNALDVSKNTLLTQLYCGDNNLTTLDVSANTELMFLQCDDNDLTALDVSHSTKLIYLNCSVNALTSIDISSCPMQWLDCHDNALTTLDAVSGAHTVFLDCTGNPLTSVSANPDGSGIELTANGGGFVGLYFSMVEAHDYYITATPDTGAAFYDWTNESDTQVSTTAQADLAFESVYDLTANFLTLSSSVPGGTIYTGGRVTLTPNMDGGEWNWDAEYFSARFNSPATFKGLQVGTSTITYTVGGVSVSYDVTIAQSRLPGTGQDFTWVWVLAAMSVLAGTGTLILKKRRDTLQSN